MLGEQGRQPLVGGVGLGRHHHAGGLLVQAVDDAGPGHAADPRQAVAAVIEQGVDQGAGLAAGGRVGGHAGRLVDDDQIGVLVQHAQRDVFRQGFGGDRRRDRHLIDAGRRLDLAVGHRARLAALDHQRHLARGDQRLQPGPRQVRRGGGQGLVQALSGQVRPDLDPCDLAGRRARFRGIEVLDVVFGRIKRGRVQGLHDSVTCVSRPRHHTRLTARAQSLAY